MTKIDYTKFIGIKKSRLTITGHYIGVEAGKTRTFFICRCDCGKDTKLTAQHFKHKEIFSCGCLRLERTATQNLIDGRKKKPEYAIWGAMVQWCNVALIRIISITKITVAEV